MSEQVSFTLNGAAVHVPAGITLAAALATLNLGHTRRSVSGQARAPLCGMGVCFECRVMIDGLAHQRACQRLVAEGMEVRTDD